MENNENSLLEFLKNTNTPEKCEEIANYLGETYNPKYKELLTIFDGVAEDDYDESKARIEKYNEVFKDLVDEEIGTLCKKIIPETEALPDEIEALKEAKQDILDNGTVSHDSINWD